MPQYIVISHIPQRQGLVGPIPEKNIVDDVEAESIEKIIEGLHIPIDGKCFVIPLNAVTIVKSRIINEIEDKKNAT